MTAVQRPGSQLETILRQLRARPPSSWQVGEREPVMRAALQQLADLAAAAAGEHPAGAPGEKPAPDGWSAASCAPVRAVPDVGVAALPDQLAVVARDALGAGVGDDRVGRLLTELAVALSIRW